MKTKNVVVRTNSAGVHFGKLNSDAGTEVTLLDSQRVWFWSGAASLSQLAMEGVKNPKDCKFAMPVDSIFLTGVIEIIPISETAFTNLKSVPLWKM